MTEKIKKKLYAIVEKTCDDGCQSIVKLFSEEWRALDYATKTYLTDWRVAKDTTARDFVEEIEVEDWLVDTPETYHATFSGTVFEEKKS